MKQILLIAVVVVGLLTALPVFAADVVVTMNLVNEQGVGKSIGTVTISEGPKGSSVHPEAHRSDAWAPWVPRSPEPRLRGRNEGRQAGSRPCRRRTL